MVPLFHTVRLVVAQDAVWHRFGPAAWKCGAMTRVCGNVMEGRNTWGSVGAAQRLHRNASMACNGEVGPPQ